MPLCTGRPIWNTDGRNLGVCLSCSLDIADHFAKLEELPALTERKAQRRMRQLENDRRRESDAASRAVAPGWIYYLRVTDRIKIGYSIDVKQRMRSYPPHAELLAVHPGTPTLEREMHEKFAVHLAQGREWFRPDDAVMDHVARVVSEFGEPPRSMVYRFREGTRQTVKPKHSVRRVG